MLSMIMQILARRLSAAALRRQTVSSLLNHIYCNECDEEQNISPGDICRAYKVIKGLDASEEEIEEAIRKKMSEEV